MSIRRNNRKMLLMTFFVSYLVLITLNPQFVDCNYNVREGDTFEFEILKIKTLAGNPFAIQFGNVVFSSGETATLKLTLVDPPYFKFKITIAGETKETALLANIVIQNRNWDELTEYYSSEFGYEIYEDRDIWGIRLNTTTKLHVDYLKRDGVLNRFYAYNESMLTSLINAGEVEINRIETGGNYNWAYSFIAILPLGALVYGIIIYKRKVNLKIAEAMAKKLNDSFLQ